MLRFVRRAAIVRWGVFSVVLPLLPIGAHLAAAWLNDETATVSFVNLFADGELLVLATVIAAAGIGEVTFDVLRQPGLLKPGGDLGLAVASAGALVVVVLSVLFFGLITFKDQTSRTEVNTAEQRARERVVEAAAISSRDASEPTGAQARQSSRSIRATLKDLRSARRAYARRPSRRHRAAVRRKSVRLKELSTRRRTLRQRPGIRALASASAAAAQSVTKTKREHEDGRQQAATISVVMFGVAFLAGLMLLLRSPHDGRAEPDKQRAAA